MEVRKMFMMSDMFWEVAGQIVAGAIVAIIALF